MQNRTFPHDGESRRFLRAVIELLDKGLRRSESASDLLDQLLQIILGAVDELERLPAGSGSHQDLKKVLRTLKRAAGLARRILKAVSSGDESVDKANLRLKGLIAGLRTDELDDRVVLRSVVVMPSVNGGGRREVIVNGESFRLARKRADVLEALAVDDGGGTGDLVAFKPCTELRERLGIEQGALTNLILHLRNFFQDTVLIDREVIETHDETGDYRVRLLRRGPAGSRTDG